MAALTTPDPLRLDREMRDKTTRHRSAREAPCQLKYQSPAVNNVTNHAYNSNPCIPFVNGYPVDVSCVHDLTGDTNRTTKLTLHFDYDVWMINAGREFGIIDNVRALEWSIYQNVAVAIGLDQCALGRQHIIPSATRRIETRRNNGPFFVRANATYVVALSSLGTDFIDLQSESCTSQQTVPNTVCFPVKGIMTAVYTGNHLLAVEAFLNNEISSQMKLSTIRVDDIMSVQYIGNRSRAAGAGAGAGSPSNNIPLSSKNNQTGLAVGVSALALFLFLLIVTVTVKLRSRAKRQEEEEDDDDDDDDNVKEGDYDEETIEFDYSSVNATVGIRTNVVNVTTPDVEPGQPPFEPDTMRCESPSFDEKAAAAVAAARGKRQRKKKKKKKLKLVKVSSRTSINEMETIEEEKESGGEGTTYCTDDEDSVEQQSSQDAWVKGSSASSTRPSPLSPLNVNEPTTSTRPKRPSPIAEERTTIRKLPPPWI